MILSIKVKKASDKLRFPFLIKTVSKPEIEGNFLT